MSPFEKKICQLKFFSNFAINLNSMDMAKRSNKSSKSGNRNSKATGRPKPMSGTSSINRRYGCGGKIKK